MPLTADPPAAVTLDDVRAAAGTLDGIAVEVVRSSFPFDICCTHTLTEHGAAGRCQLWAGHEGDDAVMFIRDCADYRNLPWARGFPVPAWRDNAANDG